MLKKFLVVGAVVGLFAGCSDTTSSNVTEQELLENPEEISSSDESVESSSSQKAEGKEDKSSAAESVKSSSSEDAEESSSSEESTSSSSEQGTVENSSSDVAESSSSAATHFDKLPFDTTGVTPDVYDIVPVDTGAKPVTSKYEPIDKEYYESYGENAKNIRWVYPKDYEGYCYIIDEPNGEYGGGFISTAPYTERIVIVREDSLLYADMYNCSDYDWEGCRNAEYAYFAKIKAGEDVFYYGEFKDVLKLVQLTDSTVSEWTVRNPSYVVPVVKGHSGWPKSMFEGDTLVTFVGDDPNSDYADTLYIEKYNVKITDGENTWIFENETCTDRGYERSAGMTDDESCLASIKYHNKSKACIKRNLGTERFVRLCRPQKDVYASWKVWCILDAEKPD